VTKDIDLFACGSTLGSLLRFVRSIDKPFRFEVEIIGNTAFFIRKENSPTELIPGVHGYGHTFPESYTTWEPDVKGSETHQRLVRYNLAGLNCVVRFECDGYLESATQESKEKKAGKSASDPYSLLSALDSTSLNLTPSTSSALNIEHRGDPVDQRTIFDLKTRSGRSGREIDMSDFHPVLWLKQIPNFIIAYHDGAGYFTPSKIHVRDVRSEVQEWEHRNKDALKRLAALLRLMVECAKKEKDKRVEVYSGAVDCLEIRKIYEGEKAGEGALPQELRMQWETGTFSGISEKSMTPEKNSSESGGYGFGAEDDDFGYSSDDHAYLYDDEYDDGSNGVELDYTACSAEDCGYCGRCIY
jgi:hypothetical protein